MSLVDYKTLGDRNQLEAIKHCVKLIGRKNHEEVTQIDETTYQHTST